MERKPGSERPFEGNSLCISSLFGGTAIRRELPKALRIVTGLICALIAISRNFLGVHTPQDILVGTGTGLLVMWLTFRMLTWIGTHPEKDIQVACIGIAVSVAVAIFAAVKPYPADYDAAGNLLVDGMKMANDTFKGVGWCAGFLLGWILERRVVQFSTDIPMEARFTRLCTGLLSYYALSLILLPLLKSGIPGAAGTVISCFLQMFYVVFLFPWCVTRVTTINTKGDPPNGGSCSPETHSPRS